MRTTDHNIIDTEKELDDIARVFRAQEEGKSFAEALRTLGAPPTDAQSREFRALWDLGSDLARVPQSLNPSSALLERIIAEFPSAESSPDVSPLAQERSWWRILARSQWVPALIPALVILFVVVLWDEQGAISTSPALLSTERSVPPVTGSEGGEIALSAVPADEPSMLAFDSAPGDTHLAPADASMMKMTAMAPSSEDTLELLSQTIAADLEGMELAYQDSSTDLPLAALDAGSMEAYAQTYDTANF